VKQYLGEVMDLGDIELAALAGAIVSKIDEPPQLSSERKGQKVLYAKLDGVGFIFSRRADSIAVHSTEFGEPMLRGLLSKNSSVSDIRRILEPSPIPATR
jgi:hypothetical protein